LNRYVPVAVLVHRAGRPRRRRRPLRPGPAGPGVPRTGRLRAEPLARRGVPERPSRRSRRPV